MTTQPLESDAFRRYDLAVSGAAEWLNILLLNSGRSNLGKELNKSKSSIDNASEEMVLGTLNTPEWKIKDEALKIISDARQALSSEDLDVSIPKKVAKLLKFNWNEERYREYVRDYSPDTYLNQVDGADEVPELMGTIDGIYIGIDVITELIELLDEGKKVPNIYWQEDSTMVFASNNETHLRIVYNKVYDELVSHTQRMVNVGMVDKETIITNEINMFQSIFDPIHNKPDVDYLGKRLGLPEYDVNEIIKKRNAVLSGEYVRAFYTYNQELRIDYGILLGVQAYLKYLRAGMVHSDEDVISKVTLTNLTRKDQRDKGEIDPYTPNLALVDDYHKNLEKAYDKLHGNFLGPDVETFKGIFIPGKYVGPIEILEHATLAEISYLVKGLLSKLRGQPWQRVNNCFAYKGKQVTKRQLQKPGGDPNTLAEQKLDEALKIIKTL